MKYDIEEIKRFVENFSLNEDGAFTEEDVDNFISSIDVNKVPDFDFDSGATKLVIIPEDRDYVIKIPFNGYYMEDDYEEEGEEYNKYFWEFEGAEGKDHSNYCEAERFLYEKAKKEGFEGMFLPIELLHIIDDYPIYIQQKAIPNSELSSATTTFFSSKESKNIIEGKKVKENCENCLYKFPLNWLASSMEVLGSYNKLYNFGMFLQSTGISGDLHNANIGYCNESAVIIDYGGYHDN